jgi:hypothetical protein
MIVAFVFCIALLYINVCLLLCYSLFSPPYKSYLVDPASSHMLVSKIKPCMSKYKHLYTVKLRTAHYISNSFFDGSFTTWITVVILELIHAENPDSRGEGWIY